MKQMRLADFSQENCGCQHGPWELLSVTGRFWRFFLGQMLGPFSEPLRSSRLHLDNVMIDRPEVNTWGP